jgi:hypothetical protein
MRGVRWRHRRHLGVAEIADGPEDRYAPVADSVQALRAQAVQILPAQVHGGHHSAPSVHAEKLGHISVMREPMERPARRPLITRTARARPATRSRSGETPAVMARARTINRD